MAKRIRLLPFLLALPLPGGAGLSHAAGDAGSCRYVQVGKLALHYTGLNLDITTDGTIDGTPAQMMLDTGAFQTFLTRTGVERRGLALHATGQYSRGVGGYATTYSVRVKEFGVGPAHVGRTTLPVLGQTGFVPAFDALLGAPYLLQGDVEFSLADKVLKFFRPSGCDDAFLGYWEGGAIAVPFESGYGNSPNPHFTVLLNGHKVDAIIDSGAAISAIELKAAQRAGLRLDAPGVTRMPDGAGIGKSRVARWSAVIDTLSIGTETVRHAEIGVIESQAGMGVEMLLGADFLRAHRVLFAMSQKKLYLAYLGGDVFSQRTGIEPWMQREADAGNPDAQYVLATMYQAGRGVARDPAQTLAWLNKAAAQGQPQANLLLGRSLVRMGHQAEGAVRLKAALDKLPAERYGALWLFLARLPGGDPAQARGELEATFARSDEHEWPAPIADFYLGRIDADALLAKARDDSRLARARGCEALDYMAEWRAARGETAESAALLASARAQCPQAASKPQAAAAQARD